MFQRHGFRRLGTFSDPALLGLGLFGRNKGSTWWKRTAHHGAQRDGSWKSQTRLMGLATTEKRPGVVEVGVNVPGSSDHLGVLAFDYPILRKQVSYSRAPGQEVLGMEHESCLGVIFGQFCRTPRRKDVWSHSSPGFRRTELVWWQRCSLGEILGLNR